MRMMMYDDDDDDDGIGMLSSCLSVRLSVRASHAGIVSKRLDKYGWFLSWELPLTYPKLCFKEIGVPPKIMVFPSGTLLQTPDLKTFAASSQWCGQ